MAVMIALRARAQSRCLWKKPMHNIILPVIISLKTEKNDAKRQWHDDFFNLTHGGDNLRIFSIHDKKAQIMVDNNHTHLLDQKTIESLLEHQTVQEFCAKTIFGQSAYPKTNLHKIIRQLRLKTLVPHIDYKGKIEGKETYILHITKQTYWLTPTSMEFPSVLESSDIIFDQKLLPYFQSTHPDVNEDEVSVCPVLRMHDKGVMSAHDQFLIMGEVLKNFDMVYNLDQSNKQFDILKPIFIDDIFQNN